MSPVKAPPAPSKGKSDMKRVLSRALQVQGEMMTYRCRGAAAELFRCKAPEVMIEGPAGTGKTRAVLEKCFQLAEEYPGCRIVFARQTRVSMTETVLVTWERFVVPKGHQCLNGPKRGNRKYYEFPNGSVIVVAGLENAESEDGHPIMSAEFDLACIFEALEVAQNDYEKVLTRLRLGVIPYQMLIVDCNPGAPGHWLNRRNGMTRLKSRHRDNPLLWDRKDNGWTQAGKMYMRNLSRLTGVRRRRLLDGLWSAAEGQVFESWDPLVHMSERKRAMKGLKWFFGVKDWGYTNPGVTQIWGVDGDARMILVSELYRTRQIIDWWIKEDQKLHAHFKCRSWVADPAEPEYMERYRRAGFPIRGAMNSIPLGIQAVADRLEPDGAGKVRMMFLNDALLGKDEALDSKQEPCSTVDEFENYVWPTPRKGDRPLDEEPIDKYNHGMDCCRYAALFVNRRAGSAESAYTNVGVGSAKKDSKSHSRGWTGTEGGLAYRPRQKG